MYIYVYIYIYILQIVARNKWKKNFNALYLPGFFENLD